VLVDRDVLEVYSDFGIEGVLELLAADAAAADAAAAAALSSYMSKDSFSRSA
jgi:hypothetical protein